MSAVTVAELDGLLAGDDEAALRERFDHPLTFGTAGLRGAVGAGPGRMNRAVVRRTAAAIARWLDETDVAGPVVVGRDARHGSAEFAEDTVRVLAAAGRDVLSFPDPVPTPLLAFALLDAYTYGFAMQEATLPFEGGDEAAELAEEMVEAMPVDEYPHLVEFATGRAMQPGYDFADEFGFGLELVLDGLERELG